MPDVGPGGDWVCLMSWDDPNVPMPPEGYGKFELNVHSNDCFTAGGPTRYTGFLTITDARGREVTNPLFEFDGCFDPAGTTRRQVSATPRCSTSPARPDPRLAGAGVPPGQLRDRKSRLSGSISGTAGSTGLRTVTYHLAEESTGAIRFPTPVPPGSEEVSAMVRSTDGYSSSDPVALPVQ